MYQFCAECLVGKHGLAFQLDYMWRLWNEPVDGYPDNFPSVWC